MSQFNEYIYFNKQLSMARLPPCYTALQNDDFLQHTRAWAKQSRLSGCA